MRFMISHQVAGHRQDDRFAQAFGITLAPETKDAAQAPDSE
jgi:hypothetical protein